MVAAQSSATSISLTWDQPLGADAVDGFEINYSYVINECIKDGDNTPFPSVFLTLTDGSQRYYMILDDFITPVEEDSQYTISIRAINSVGRSAPSNTATTTTSSAGECFLNLDSE